MAGRTIRIRHAVPSDAAIVIRFNAALAQESESIALDPQLLAAGVQAVLVDPARGQYFLAETDHRVVGQTMITTEWSDWRNGFFWWIQSVYVEPDFRRRGVFRSLHDHIREEAQRRNHVCGLRLYVHHDNSRALETYAALGMIRSAYHMIEECWGPPG